jgi:hypothetical protein
VLTRYDSQMSKTPGELADARKRAQAAVAQIKARVARQAGVPAPEAGADDETEHAPARPAKARTQPHPAARTQRPQGRREGK